MITTQENIVFTIGHSNHTIDGFISLLQQYSVTAVTDVRSTPYSRHYPQFNRECIELSLAASNIAYVFLGLELGARPDNATCYEGDKVNFAMLEQTDSFKTGIQRLIEGMTKYRVAIMCAEKEPLNCHRTILICRHLKTYGLTIRHILADGAIEDHNQAEKRLMRLLKIEPDLFEPNKKISDYIDEAYKLQAQRISSTKEEQKHHAPWK